MSAIVDYTTLCEAFDDFTERSYTSDEKDRFIGLAEGEFRLYLGPHFAKETSATVPFTSGSGTLPTGFVRALALTHSTYGPLTEKAIGEIRSRRVFDTTGVPDIYAIVGSTIEVAPTYTGNLTFDYEGTLTGLSGSNATNWIILAAPQAYLSMCLSFEKAFNEDWNGATLLSRKALGTLDDLGLQAIVASHGRSAVTIPGATP